MKNVLILDNLKSTDMPQEMINEVMTEPISLAAIYLAGKVVEAEAATKTYTEGES